MIDFNNILLRQFRVDLLERDKNTHATFLRLKYNYDYSDICYIVDDLSGKSNTYDENIYGRSLPASIDELGDFKVLYGDAKNAFEQEVNWALLSVRKYAAEIQYFIRKQSDYEKALLTGDYKRANEILDEIEKKVCVSLWGIEQRFILIEIEKGLKENTKYLNEINEKNKKWFIKRFSHFFSLKAEKELSVNQYSMSLARLLFRYFESDNQIDFHYYIFKLNFLEADEQKNLPDFLAIESHHSIIDKYISLVRVLQLAVLDGNKEQASFLDSRLYYLSKKVNDFNLEKLRLLINTSFEFDLTPKKSDTTNLKFLDCYTNGKYSEVVKSLKTYLLECPLSVELYEIYLKSLILLNREFEPIGLDKDSIQNRILYSLYSILSRDDSMLENLNEIRKIAYNISSIYSISFYLMNFYKKESEGKGNLIGQMTINTSFLNPSLIRHFKKSSIDQLPLEFRNSTSLEYLSQQENGTIESIQNANLTEERKKILKAFYFQKNNRFDKALTLWEEILNEPSIKNFQKERVLQNLFKCLEALDEFDKCINLYVDSYFENPLLVSNINVTKIKKTIKKAKYKIVTHSISLPLFYKLTNSEDYDIHTTYECFLIAQDCFTPSEFLEQLEEQESEKIIFFLKDICTLAIFKHSPFITSSKHKYDERILVCKRLAKIDTDSQREHENEIERLTKRLIIQKGIQEVDESKIYVNQTGIIESEIKNLSSVFKRFKMIGELKSEKDISILSLYSDKMFSFKLSEEEDGNEFSKDPQFDIYKDIFYFIRDKFLYSTYGLQQYLSARIRHGVLLGEIRPEFESLNLITEKEKGIEKYKDNQKWGIYTTGLTGDNHAKFQNILSTFSYSVDALINEEILSKSLQINVDDKNKDGWLDYNFDDLTLQFNYISDKKSETVEEFANAIFNQLWIKTEENLIDIKAKINGDIKDKFYQLLLELEQGLNSVFGTMPEQIENNINEARVNIENKLIKIANWFSITESNISDFQIEKIVDVSLEYNKSINITKEIHCYSYFKGSYYPALVDLLRIFMDNASKHAGFDNDTVPFHVKIEELQNEAMVLKFKNPLSSSINSQELDSKISSFSLDLTKSMKEGESGWHKAMRIIKTDLDHQENNMIISLNDLNEFCVEVKLNKKPLLV